jgi:hypothetical protein
MKKKEPKQKQGYPHAKDHDFDSFEKAVDKAYLFGDLAGFDKAAKSWSFEIGWLLQKYCDRYDVRTDEEHDAFMSWFDMLIKVEERLDRMRQELLARLRRPVDVEF